VTPVSAVWPWKNGEPIPGGVAPANRLHCSGPPTQPVVVKKWVLTCPALNVCGVGGSITHAPEGGGRHSS
jgi:hypothetical protein